MSKKTLVLILTLLALTIVLVVVAVTNRPSTPSVQQSQQRVATPTPTPPVPGHTTLSLSPSPVTPLPGTPTIVNVLIDTGGDEVRSVQLEIAYDPKVLTGMTVKPGTFFTNPTVLPVGGVNQSTGRITYAIVPSSFKESQKGIGQVAQLSFYLRQASASSTAITILDKSLVTGNTRGQNVLVKSTGTDVLFAPAR